MDGGRWFCDVSNNGGGGRADHSFLQVQLSGLGVRSGTVPRRSRTVVSETGRAKRTVWSSRQSSRQSSALRRRTRTQKSLV